MQHSEAAVDLSIIVTVHAEGILLHKTLASIRRALVPYSKQGYTHELIIHCDNASDATLAYIQSHNTDLEEADIFYNTFGDLGSSRNFAVKQAAGRYVSFIDADDLMSEQWLARGVAFLDEHESGKYIAHTEKTVEFGGADAVIIKHGETNQAADTLLSVFANRWNSIIIAPREILIEEPYTKNSAGFGYEDWHLNCRFIHKGIHNVLIPETVIFVRRKASNSEWARQISSRAVLGANPLLAFGHVRGLPEIAWESQSETRLYAAPRYRQKAKALLQKAPRVEHYARKAYQVIKARKETARQAQDEARLPKWLVDEWRNMQTIEKQLFPTEHLLRHMPIYDSFSPDHISAAKAYQQLIRHTKHDSYGYIIFVPWLIKGGADKVAINLAEALVAKHPDKPVAVIATLPELSPWADLLPDGVDFIPFGTITNDAPRDVQHRLLEHFVENSGAGYLHIINSELAYDFIESHETYIKASGKKVLATSFSQSTDTSGRIFGYSHTHVPKIYDLSTAITSDNQAVVDMWVREYGFDRSKLSVQHQPVDVSKLPKMGPRTGHSGLHILWAARLSYEKQPELVPQIASLLADKGITIDMFGSLSHGYGDSFLRSLPANVTYKGAFDGFFTLPLDQYDVFLYTSLFDGMPNAILEAAAAKLPIVASAVGGIPEFIEHQKNGLLIQEHQKPQAYADGLVALKENPEKLHDFGNLSYDLLLKRHSPSNFEEEIASFLRSIGY